MPIHKLLKTPFVGSITYYFVRSSYIASTKNAIICAAVLGQHTPSTVKINGNTVNFGSHAPNGLFSAAGPTLDSDYILLQTKTDLSKAELRELNELGADLQEYYGQEIYLFHYTPTSLKPLLEKGFVLNAVPYQKGLKINSHLKQTKVANPQSTETIHVVLHERKSEEVNKIITDLASRAGLDKSDVTVDGNKIEMTVSTSKLDALADMDSVRTIEQVPEKVIFNNVARDIMSANVILNDTSYTGKGQTVAVADTGLDTGNIDTIHPAFKGRVKDLIPLGCLMNPKALDAYGPSPDPLYQFSTGTSMATPLVSGCAAVLREVLVKNGIEKPSAALLKALLINGAFTLHHAHSAKEGFGRVNLNNAIILPNQTEHAGFVEGQPLKDRGESRTITLTIPPASALEAKQASANDNVITLKVTLVYTDRPGEGLQNDLNLIVKTPDGIERHGNMGTAEEFDRYNNVEQIVWRDIPQGKVEVTVKAARVLTDQQDYALVWRVIRGEE
ncbi:hypothetical protein DIS24_g12491 [Lasiodiplodia hormozganensis]|uniref:Peptidase S8/S53 domain-containing protein n=1 Tax=Lasiodiplodia hormozganensis TaxID=869390 RepID=A0AA39U0H4_9PEZI|nr:hypothetical protein DIS24_g12491 [Lasiodiplodia hormozganensis]